MESNKDIQTKLSLTPYNKDFKWNDVDYSFYIHNVLEGILIRVSKPLDPSYWESTFQVSELQKAYPYLYSFTDDEIIEYLINSMETNEFDFNFDETKLTIDYWIVISKGKMVTRQIFKFELLIKKGDLEINQTRLASHLQKIDNNYENFKNTIEIKFNDIQNKFQEQITLFIDQAIKNNEKSIKDLELSVEQFFEKQKNLLDLERLKFFRDTEKYNIINLNSGDNNVVNKRVEKLLPKFINPSNTNYTFSNENRTIEKTGADSAFYGFRCEEIPAALGVYEYSIRIDNTDNNCNIMVGFCLNTHNPASGFYNGQCLAMIYLSNGQIYSNYVESAANGFRALKNIIITATIDTVNKFITFTLNGYQLQAPKCFTIVETDIPKICPCVDVYTQGDKVTIVKT